MWHFLQYCLVWYVGTNVSEKHSASFIRIEAGWIIK